MMLKHVEVLPYHSWEYLSSVYVDDGKRSGYTKLADHGEPSQNIGMICRQKHERKLLDGREGTVFSNFTQTPSYLQGWRA